MGWETELFMILVTLAFLVRRQQGLRHYIVMVPGWRLLLVRWSLLIGVVVIMEITRGN